MAGQMMNTIKLSRGDSSPWGFRLQGGKDWSLPLSVSKVQAGSLADKGGLKVGDIIAKICGHNAEGMLHKEAQDVILRAGNNLEITVVKGCTSTWQPKVTPIAPSTGGKTTSTTTGVPRPASSVFDPVPLTKTSLAYNQMPSTPVGSSHNTTAVPFQTFGTTTLPLVNKQYNSPINLYSMKNIKETIDAHSELIAPGVKGINFMKPDAPVNTQSAVYQAILEEEAKSKGTSPVPPSQVSGAGTSSPVPRIGFPPHSLSSRPGPVTKHVEAPIYAPKAIPEGPPSNVCAECGRLIVGVFCRVNEKNLHAECFKCSTCGNSLKNVGYFNINDKLYCEVHAVQAAKISNRNSTYEPLAMPVESSSSFALNSSGFQAGLAPATSATAGLTSTGSNFVPSSIQPSGKTSPLLQAVSAMPWHSTQTYHHVDAPVSPVPGQQAGSKGFSLLQNRLPATNPSPLPPKFDQPRPGSIYQPSPQPYSAPSQTVNQPSTTAPAPVVGGSKFSWPPKGATSENQLTFRSSGIQNQQSSVTSTIEQSTNKQSIQLIQNSSTTGTASLTSQPEPVPVTVLAASSTTSEQKEQQIVSEQVATDVLNQAIPVAASQLQSPVSNQPVQPVVQLPNLPSVTPVAVASASAAPQPPAPSIQSQVSPQIPPPVTTSLTDPQTEPSLPFMKPLELRSRSNSVTNAVAEIERQVTQVTPLPTGGKVAPPTLPKPTSNSTPTPWSSATGPATTFPSAPTTTSSSSTSTSTSVPLVPAPGRSTIAGSKQAPRRGRGQLKPPGTPGTRVPICAVCQVPIRGPFIVALGKTWCRDHFNCANNQCRRSLQEIGFVEEQGLLYCESCFEAYLPICAKCNVPIKGECLIAIDKNWHPNCFACCYCKNLLGNNPFYLEDGLPYCQRDWSELFTTKCIACGFPIAAGDRWVEALNNNFHAECFKCTACHSKLEGQSFYAKGGRPYCKSHAR